MDDFEKHLEKRLEDPEFKRLWEEGAPRRNSTGELVESLINKKPGS